MKILIVGAGAVGGYFGARLAQAGRDVTFLVRPSRATQLQRDGLRIVSPNGDLTLKPQLITTQQIHAPYDLVFLSVKAPALDHAIADMRPAIGPNTMIYPVLNGMRHIETLAQTFGENAVLGGVCLVATELDSEGRIVQLSGLQKLTYGERSGAITDRIRAVDQAFSNAGFETELSTNIMQAMWQKWAYIATIGLTTCLFGGPIGQINAVPDGEDSALSCLDECAATVTAAGFPPEPSFLDRVRQQLTAKGSPATSSMYRDMQKGAQVEDETILGDLLKHAQEHHLKTPFLQAGVVRLRVYQNARNPS